MVSLIRSNYAIPVMPTRDLVVQVMVGVTVLLEATTRSLLAATESLKRGAMGEVVEHLMMHTEMRVAATTTGEGGQVVDTTMLHLGKE